MITSTALKAVINNPCSRNKLRQAIYNAGVLGWSVDHVRDRLGDAYLAVRVHSGKVLITDKHGRNLTRVVKKLLTV